MTYAHQPMRGAGHTGLSARRVGTIVADESWSLRSRGCRPKAGGYRIPERASRACLRRRRAQKFRSRSVPRAAGVSFEPDRSDQRDGCRAGERRADSRLLWVIASNQPYWRNDHAPDWQTSANARALDRNGLVVMRFRARSSGRCSAGDNIPSLRSGGGPRACADQEGEWRSEIAAPRLKLDPLKLIRLAVLWFSDAPARSRRERLVQPTKENLP
jgi:hypothetical protein